MTEKRDAEILEAVIKEISGAKSAALEQLITDLLDRERQVLHQVRPRGLLQRLTAELDAHLEGR